MNAVTPLIIFIYYWIDDYDNDDTFSYYHHFQLMCAMHMPPDWWPRARAKNTMRATQRSTPQQPRTAQKCKAHACRWCHDAMPKPSMPCHPCHPCHAGCHAACHAMPRHAITIAARAPCHAATTTHATPPPAVRRHHHDTTPLPRHVTHATPCRHIDMLVMITMPPPPMPPMPTPLITCWWLTLPPPLFTPRRCYDYDYRIEYAPMTLLPSRRHDYHAIITLPLLMIIRHYRHCHDEAPAAASATRRRRFHAPYATSVDYF